MQAAASVVVFVLSASAVLAEDWTGGFLGGQVGYSNIDPSDNRVDTDGFTYGVHAGYDHDFGDWVLGGELDYDRLNIDIGSGTTAVNADHLYRAKLRLGYDFGDALGYVVAGPARLKTSAGSYTEAFYGLGVSVLMSPSWSITGEYLYQDFNDAAGGGVDAKIQSFTLRAAFRF
ncbi:porin family protein [Rhodobacteraceae bacterium F11138]|nr:porin family protein [Rhodobacteraceae bacterium F11138]